MSKCRAGAEFASSARNSGSWVVRGGDETSLATRANEDTAPGFLQLLLLVAQAFFAVQRRVGYTGCRSVVMIAWEVLEHSS